MTSQNEHYSLTISEMQRAPAGIVAVHLAHARNVTARELCAAMIGALTQLAACKRELRALQDEVTSLKSRMLVPITEAVPDKSLSFVIQPQGQSATA